MLCHEGFGEVPEPVRGIRQRDIKPGQTRHDAVCGMVAGGTIPPARIKFRIVPVSRQIVNRGLNPWCVPLIADKGHLFQQVSGSERADTVFKISCIICAAVIVVSVHIILDEVSPHAEFCSDKLRDADPEPLLSIGQSQGGPS